MVLWSTASLSHGVYNQGDQYDDGSDDAEVVYLGVEYDVIRNEAENHLAVGNELKLGDVAKAERFCQ
jgi:hypothetical protein